MTVACLWTLAAVAEATGGRIAGDPAPEYSGIAIDSRTVGRGDLFVAIAGDRFDGHDFVESAIAGGAGAGLVLEDKAEALERKGLPLIVVPDAFEGLRDLARAARARTSAKVVAVTGSVGKTSTREAIRHALSAIGRTHASVKSFNNHWGVPLTLARMPEDTEFAVIEIGMNHAGEITPLTQMTRPHVAMVTTVAPAHLEFFDSVAGIAHAKAEIFEGLGPGGMALIGLGHEHEAILRDAAAAHGATILTYGRADNADIRIVSETSGPTASGRIDVRGEAVDVTLDQAGGHALFNAAGALAVASAVGADVKRCAEALSAMKAVEGRGAVHQLGRITLIDESYNANPASMRAALSVLHDTPASQGRRIAVLGDMLELGPQSAKLHAELSQAVINSGVQKVYLVGGHMARLAEELPAPLVAAHANSTAEISPKVLNSLAFGDVIMVKGSLGVGLGGLVNDIRARFASEPGKTPPAK
ncbi:UDP-N-acetylmuramoyl-tripeptide--D-alanyl-D-alanine ligase [Cucumibacter marinus]|uniref:UDP-N-acetylmuramoyl-tripeptide--D-alanyl-D- alanine ligase n=1 Tax=Cucumibacter marinus TaxID=1121252 RepID=UPI00041ED97E|nr:UDP-N-acetylmuramoyl-tripeptide--D-alanyl-D-alanine ligase [Cucumibacter marinus]